MLGNVYVFCNGIYQIKLRSEQIEAPGLMPPCPKDLWCATLDFLFLRVQVLC